MDSETTALLKCPKCGSEETKPGYGVSFKTCPSCVAARRLERFNALCPITYAETDESRLNRHAWALATACSIKSSGLLLTGATGLGKTRIAWMLIKRLMTDGTIENFHAFDCVSFAHDLVEHYRAEDAESWLRGLVHSPLVFFDDLGKLKLTERAEAELFGVVERRCARGMPILATTNDTGATLASRMTDNRGAALIRRLREFCEVIHVMPEGTI